jgi:hypothetical protein
MDVRQQVARFTESLERSRPSRGPAKDTRKAIDLILSHLKDHGPYLWGHAICLPEHAGNGIRLVDRTNNILEDLFGGMKHQERRRSGRKNLTQDLENLPPEAALTSNLRCPDYVSIVCGSLDRLHEAFSNITLEENVLELQESNQEISALYSPLTEMETASLPKADRDLIRTDLMYNRIVAAAKSRAPRFQG